LTGFGVVKNFYPGISIFTGRIKKPFGKEEVFFRLKVRLLRVMLGEGE
tara:strand:+ start:842 stop:985 length:144 start_codon:yes stop_codon:yes gene_type:complete